MRKLIDRVLFKLFGCRQNTTRDLVRVTLPGWLRRPSRRAIDPRTRKLRRIPLLRVYVNRGWDRPTDRRIHDGRTPVRRPSWTLNVQLGSGGGYRWIDLPGYCTRPDCRFYRLRRRLSISGRTLTIAHNVKIAPTVELDGRGARGVHTKRSGGGFVTWYARLTTSGNPEVFPNW